MFEKANKDHCKTSKCHKTVKKNANNKLWEIPILKLTLFPFRLRRDWFLQGWLFNNRLEFWFHNTAETNRFFKAVASIIIKTHVIEFRMLTLWFGSMLELEKMKICSSKLKSKKTTCCLILLMLCFWLRYCFAWIC